MLGQPSQPWLSSQVRVRGKKSSGKSCFVIGVGNPFMRDDGVGVEVARSLRKLNLGRQVVVLERQVADLSLLAYAKEASRLIIVDAAESGSSPGTVIRFAMNDPPGRRLRIRFSHELGLSEFAALVKQSGMPLASVVILGVQPSDCGPGEGLSKPVADALPTILKMVIAEIKKGDTRRAKLPVRP